jgi:hypothetical protein
LLIAGAAETATPESPTSQYPINPRINNQQSTINNQQCPPVRVPDGFFVAIFRIHGLGAAVHAIESGRVLSNDQYQLNP